MRLLTTLLAALFFVACGSSENGGGPDDRNGSDAGIPGDDAGTSGDDAGGADLPTRSIFLSGATHDGAFGTTPGEAIANADALCNADANKPAGAGTFKALLSGNGASSVRRLTYTEGAGYAYLNWPLAANTTYVLPSGAVFGTTNADRVFENPEGHAMIALPGALVPTTPDVSFTYWTGLAIVLANISAGGDNCGNWTTNIEREEGCPECLRTGGIGTTYPTEEAPQTTFASAQARCNSVRALVCVEQ
jgi:trimeric autotransporter adhesin